MRSRCHLTTTGARSASSRAPDTEEDPVLTSRASTRHVNAPTAAPPGGRTARLGALIAATAMAAAACSSGSGAAVTVPTLTVRTVAGVGSVLTTAAGETLYVFAPDARHSVTCHDECAGTWPPLFTETGQTATAGSGVQAGLIGADADGSHPVATYAGWPLYRYVADATGSASGQAIDLNGGYWYVMRADGTPVVPAGDPALPGA